MEKVEMSVIQTIRGFNFKIKTTQDKLRLSFQYAQNRFFILIPLTTISSQIMTSNIYAYYDTCNVCSLVFCVQYTSFFHFSVHVSVTFYNVDGNPALTDLSKD